MKNGLLIIACEVLGAILIMLKIFEVITIGWYWVLAPIWVPAVFLGIELIVKKILKRKDGK